MEIASALLIAIVGAFVIALIQTAIEGGAWAVRPIVGKTAAYAILIWISLAGPLKIG
jgi:hypothetical protein